MKSKEIIVNDIWKFPYGSQVFFSSDQARMLDSDLTQGIYTFCHRDHELGDLFVNEFGELAWNSGELSGESVSIYAIETIDLIRGYIKGLVAYSISLQDEPIMHASTIAFIEVNIRNMRSLEDLLEMDQQTD